MRMYVQHAYALVVGMCFVFAAIAAIEYHETVAPQLERVNASLAKLPRLWA